MIQPRDPAVDAPDEIVPGTRSGRRRTGEQACGLRQLRRPVLQNGLQIALKPSRRHDDIPRKKIPACSAAEIADLHTHDPAGANDQIVGHRSPQESDVRVTQAGAIDWLDQTQPLAASQVESWNGIAGRAHEPVERDPKVREPVVEPHSGIAHIGRDPSNIVVFAACKEVFLRELRRIGDFLAVLQGRPDDADCAVGEDRVAAADGRHVDDEHLRTCTGRFERRGQSGDAGADDDNVR